MAPKLEEAAVNPSCSAELCVYTLGGFRLLRDGVEIESTAWTREKALHLFQFLVTARRAAVLLHKERIIDDLWPESDAERGDRDFKVALNAVNNALEPERQARATPRYVVRSDLAYGLDFGRIWVDADAFEEHVAAGSAAWTRDERDTAIRCYTEALSLYRGDYLPERRYEDWSSAERERLQVLALNVMTTLAGLLLERNPLESLRLTQRVLAVDPIWEDAYRIQMQAYPRPGQPPAGPAHLRAVRRRAGAGAGDSAAAGDGGGDGVDSGGGERG